MVRASKRTSCGTRWCSIRGDRERLQDILHYAQAAIAIVEGHRPEDDLLGRLALERALFLVGEAAAHLSAETKKDISQPWRDVVGLRNFLAHQYPDIDVSLLVTLTHRRLPDLVGAVDAYLR